jgi:hypothetical protein
VGLQAANHPSLFTPENVMTATAPRKSKIRASLAALGAAVLLAFGLGLAQPGTAAAGLTDSTRAYAPAAKVLPSERAASERIIVAEKPWKNKGWNKGWNKGPGKWGKNWGPNKIVVRPYRRWYKRPHYGRIIGGIALGTILGAAAYSAIPPAPDLCWYWADPHQTRGYWDYCY